MRGHVLGILFGGTLILTIPTSFVTGAEPVISVAPTGISGDLAVEGLGFTPDESVRVVVRKGGQHQGVEVPQGSVTADGLGSFNIRVPASFLEQFGCEGSHDEFMVSVMNNRGPGEAIQLLAGPVSVHAAGPIPASTGMAGDRLDRSTPNLVLQAGLAAALTVTLAGMRFAPRLPTAGETGATNPARTPRARERTPR